MKMIINVPLEMNQRLKVLKTTLNLPNLESAVLYVLNEYVNSTRITESVSEMLAGFSNSKKEADRSSSNTTPEVMPFTLKKGDAKPLCAKK